jgi:hypothetical protein
VHEVRREMKITARKPVIVCGQIMFLQIFSLYFVVKFRRAFYLWWENFHERARTYVSRNGHNSSKLSTLPPGIFNSVVRIIYLDHLPWCYQSNLLFKAKQMYINYKYLTSSRQRRDEYLFIFIKPRLEAVNFVLVCTLHHCSHDVNMNLASDEAGFYKIYICKTLGCLLSHSNSPVIQFIIVNIR